jgi:hypothetical protein
MTSRSLRRFGLAIGFAAALLGALAACGPSPSSTPAGTATTVTSPPSPSSALSPAEVASPSSPTGFAFDAESVVGYYRTQGYACGSPQPSALAEGYQFTSCQLVDTAGRTRVVGVVTDANDELADGFGSVRGTATETILDPSAALDPLAGFLGAMLGQSRGESLLPWLASHLGDSFAETTIGDLHVATYIKGDDHSTLYVELANQAYLLAPRPSPS